VKKIIDRLFSDINVSAYLNWIIRNRYIVLLLAIILTCASAVIVKKISVDSSIMALLKKNTPAVQRINGLEKKLGGIGDLIVMVESGNKEQSIHVADEMLKKINKLEWVADASYSINDSLLVKKKLLYISVDDLEEIRNRVERGISGKIKKANPLFVDLLDEPQETFDFSDIEKKYEKKSNYKRVNISQDGKMLLIVIHPEGITSNISFAKKTYNELHGVVTEFTSSLADSSVTISIGGTYKNRLNEYNTIISDLSNGTMLGVAVILILLLIYFKRISLIICVLIPLIMSESWTFALTVLSIGNLNLITAFLIIILFGLGIDFGIHLINRYMLARKEGADHFDALKMAIQTSGRASLTSGLTVIVSFYMLTFSDFLGFRDFGFIAGTGILLAYIAYMILTPALLTVANDLTHGFGIKSKSITTIETNNSVRPNHKIALVAISIVLFTVISIVMLKNVKFEYDFRNLRSQISTTREFNNKMRNVFTTARDPSVVVVKDAHDALKIKELIKSKGLLDDTSIVEDVKSINDIIPLHQEEKIAVIKEIKTILERNKKSMSPEQKSAIEKMECMLVTEPVTEKDVPEEILKLFYGNRTIDGQLMYIYQRNSLLDLHNAEAFANAVGTLNIDNKTFYAVSEPLVYVELISLLKKDSIIAIIAAFVIIAGIVFSDFGKIRSMLIILSPLCIGIVWMLGIMGIFSLKLNIFNMVILPSILGLGVDAAVHIYHRFHSDANSPISKLLIETGGPNFLCTLINLVGFGGIITANHPGLRSIGELAIIGMSTCLAASLTILPVIISLERKRRIV
jgi:predicted RND superfamily exporter protein